MVKSLEQSEQFKEIFEKSPIGILFYDKKGILIDSNQSALEIARVSQFSDIEGTNLFDNPYIESHKEELLKNGFIRFESPIDLNKVKELGFYIPTRDEFIYVDYTVSVIDSGFIAQIQDITRYKEAANSLYESESKYHGLFDSMEGAIQICELIFDKNGKPVDNLILDVNSAYEKHSGLRKDEVLGQRIKEVIPVVEQVWLDRYAEVVHENKPMHFEEYNEGLDRWFDVQASPLGGNRFAAVFIDITERKKTEKALQESQKLLQDLINGFPSAIFVKDVEGRFIIVNNKLEELLGVKNEELNGKTDYDIITKELADFYRVNDRRVLEEGRAITFEEEADLVDGHHVFIANKFPIYDYDGNPYGVGSISTDITERKLLEEELRDNEGKLRALFENLPVGISVLNSERKVIYENPALEKILGLSKEELKLGRYTNRRYFKSDMTEISLNEFPSTMAFNEQAPVKDAEVGVLKEDNSMIWTNVSAIPLTSPDWKMLIVTTNITDRKDAEMKIYELLEDTRQFAEELEVSNEELQATTEELQASNEELNATTEELRLANMELQESYERFDLAQKVSNVGAFEWNIQTGVNTWTPELEAMYGLQQGEFPGTQGAWEELIHPEDKQKAINGVDAALETGKPVESEFRVIWPDGSIHWLLGRWQVIKDDSGDLQKLIGVNVDITERKKDEQALKESEKRYRSILENIPDAYFRGDKKGKIIMASDSAARMYGYDSPEEIIGLPIIAMYKNKEERELVLNELKKHGKIVDNEIQGVKKDNTLFWASQNAQYYYDENGQIQGTESFVRDITLRKQIEEELRQARDNLEEQVEQRTTEIKEAYQLLKESELKAKQRADLLDVTHEAIFVRDIDDKITFWNNGAEELYGWTKKEAMGNISHNLIKTEFPMSLEQIKNDVLSKGRWDGELVQQKMDGTKIQVLSRWSLQRDREHNPIGFLEVNVDITERKNAEEQLKKSLEKLSMERKRFFDILEELPVMISLLTADCHVKFGNRAYREKFGEHYGRHCYDFIFGFDEPCHWCEAFKPLETGQPHHWDLKTPDGLEIENYNIPFTDFDGSPLVLEMNIDVTDKKQVERQLKETILELKRSNEELQSFAYITSHDLQEPLRTIASYSQLIKRRYGGQLDADADEFIDFMVAGAKRMKQQIQGLLEYSRVGTRGGDFWRFDSQKALKHALSNLDSSIQECHAEITYDSLPSVLGDEAQITRVFQNLIGNALKFSREGVTPRIHISAAQKDDEYIFSVSDNGVGMEIQYADKIFDIFKRLHSIGEYEGSGIGLSIVKRIIERHGGRIWVESEFGVGSTFYFTLPLGK